MTTCASRLRDRAVLFLSTPALWPSWPFLPVVRRCNGQEELGVVFDSFAVGLTGYSASVFLTNMFCLPRTLEEFLALAKETFDTREEMAAAGWLVD